MVEQAEAAHELELPRFYPGRAIRETEHYRIVMDWKPGAECTKKGRRFFIEPKTPEAHKMLQMAAELHGFPGTSLNLRKTPDKEVEIRVRFCLRADFIQENLPALLNGVTESPKPGEDTIPSPDRMEECLKLHPEKYTFSDFI